MSTNYTQLEATIWLTKGDHFFFYCDQRKNYAPTVPIVNDTTVYDYSPLKHDILCMLESMQASYPKTDNVKLTIRSLRCDSIEAKSTNRARFDLAWFYTVCSNIGGLPPKDERAVVHLNSQNFYFNVTNFLTIEDVKFDGINGFSHFDITETVNGEQQTSVLQTPYWPAKLCQLDIPPINFQITDQNTALL